MIRLLFLALLFTWPAAAQETDLARSPRNGEPSAALEQAADELGIDLHADKPEGQGTLIQPLDDTDPVSRALLDQWYATVPCQDESSVVYCEKALDILRGGGDALARYLIHLNDLNEKAAYPNQQTYLTLLGRTESDVAYDYLRKRTLDAARTVEQTGQGHERLYAGLECLGLTRKLAALDDAAQLVERFPGDVGIAHYTLTTVRQVERKHGLQPRATQVLQALHAHYAGLPRNPEAEEDENSPPGIRAGAERMLASPERAVPR